MKYRPYVPVSRLTPILEEFMERYGLNQTDLARELAAHTMLSEESWQRRLYSWRNGETDAVRFPVVDSVLTALDLSDRWYTDLRDIYDAA